MRSCVSLHTQHNNNLTARPPSNTRQMDSVIEKLSNLESIWRITSDEIGPVINSDDYNEEFDVFKYKIPETEVHIKL